MESRIRSENERKLLRVSKGCKVIFVKTTVIFVEELHRISCLTVKFLLLLPSLESFHYG